MDRQLAVWNDGQGRGPDWLLTPAPLLSRLINGCSGTQRLDAARHKAWENVNRQRWHQNRASSGQAPSHADVLVALTLGTWVTFLPGGGSDPGTVHLWQEALSRGFPNLGSGGASADERQLTSDAHTLLPI